MAKWLSPLAFAQVAHSQEHFIRVLAWMKTADGAKGKNPPKPLPAPWVEQEKDTTHFGGEAVPWDEMASWLGWEAQMTAPDNDD